MVLKNERIKFIGFMTDEIVIIKDKFNNTYRLYLDKKLKACEYLTEGEEYTISIEFKQDNHSIGYVYATIIDI